MARENLVMFGRAPESHWLCDLLFLLFAGAYAFLALQGIIPISANGALLDSDLETYAQGMAGEYHTQLFAADPVLKHSSPANSIPNLERMLASLLMPPDMPGVGLLRAGAIAIFVFYAGWYALGRYIYKSPALSAILALLCGITVWVGWGTFWGVSHSDPVPRVFFASIFPFLLILAIRAAQTAWMRPLACLACGLCIWVHGLSAINCGAMFLTAFFFLKPAHSSLQAHIVNTLICVIAFCIPTLIFLWPSLGQSKSFSAEEMEIFKDVFDLRWREDYAGFAKRIKSFLNPAQAPLQIILGGLGCWFLVFFKGNRKEQIFCRLCPGFLAALVLLALFCWLESRWSPMLGRLPMGHEFVRGLRFLVPLSWVLVGAAIGIICGKWLRRFALIGILTCVALFSVDRQYMAAQYALSRQTGTSLPLSAMAEREKFKAEKYRELYEEIQKIVPPYEAVFSTGEEMGIRFVSLRPLAHTFKDGYVFYYNKDLSQSAKWLEYEKLLRQGPEGYIKAWLQSDAPWILCAKTEAGPELEKYGRIMLDKNGWILARRK